MNAVEPIVFLVDDDQLFRRSTERLIRTVGLNVQPFSSARDFLKSPRPEGPACLVLDVRMPCRRRDKARGPVGRWSNQFQRR